MQPGKTGSNIKSPKTGTDLSGKKIEGPGEDEQNITMRKDSKAIQKLSLKSKAKEGKK